MYFKSNYLLQFIEWQIQQRKEAESLLAWTGCYLFEHENGNDCCLKLDASKSSINLWSDTLALAAAKRWYSSNTEVRHHLCNFLKHPTRQPVRCFPRLQWINTGWFLTSIRTPNASRIFSSGMVTKGSLQFLIPNWNKRISFALRNSMFASGYGSGHRYIMERRPSVWRKEKLSTSGKPERKMPLSTIAKLRGGMKNSSSLSASARL